LASSQYPTRLFGVDNTYAYWTSFPNTGKAPASEPIYKTPIAGGPTTTVAQASNVYSLGVDATAVYFPLNDTIVAAPIPGGATRVVATDTSTSTVAAANGNIYWFDEPDGGGAPLVAKEAPVDGGAPTTISLPSQVPPTAAVFSIVSNDAVYALVPSGIVRVPFDGSPAGWFDAPLGGLTADDTNLYWMEEEDNNSYELKTISKSGGGSATLATEQGLTGGLAVDASFLYFTQVAPPGRILKMPKGGGQISIVVDNQNYPQFIAVDDTNIYWDDFGGTTIKKLAK
jgi:hypothetical protein